MGLAGRVTYSTNVVSHNFMPHLLAACDIYAAPSRLEGFGMIQVEGQRLRPAGGRHQRHGLPRHHGPGPDRVPRRYGITQVVFNPGARRGARRPRRHSAAEAKVDP